MYGIDAIKPSILSFVFRARVKMLIFCEGADSELTLQSGRILSELSELSELSDLSDLEKSMRPG